MIGNSLHEYIFIRASIIALRLVAPTSIVYLAASAYARSFFLSRIIGAFAIAEASFYLFVYVPRKRRLQQARFIFSRTQSLIVFGIPATHLQTAATN